MRKIIVSIRSTFNGVVTGPADDDPTNFMIWAQTGIEDTSEDFSTLPSLFNMCLVSGCYQKFCYT
jgi:hypothetical protein